MKNIYIYIYLYDKGFLKPENVINKIVIHSSKFFIFLIKFCFPTEISIFLQAFLLLHAKQTNNNLDQNFINLIDNNCQKQKEKKMKLSILS